MSIPTERDCQGSALLAPSVAANSRVWRALPAITTSVVSAATVTVGPPSIRYEMESTPAPPVSVAASRTVTDGERYHGGVPAVPATTWAVVTGASASVPSGRSTEPVDGR